MHIFHGFLWNINEFIQMLGCHPKFRKFPSNALQLISKSNKNSQKNRKITLVCEQTPQKTLLLQQEKKTK